MFLMLDITVQGKYHKVIRFRSTDYAYFSDGKSVIGISSFTCYNTSISKTVEAIENCVNIEPTC